MKERRIRSMKSIFSLRSKILLGALALAIVALSGPTANAASGNAANKLLLSQMNLFDPFKLQSTSASITESDSGAEDMLLLEIMSMSNRPPIRIPYRPVLRSPFRPPL